MFMSKKDTYLFCCSKNEDHILVRADVKIQNIKSNRHRFRITQ